MIYEGTTLTPTRAENFKDGSGHVLFKALGPVELLGGKGRVFSHVTLEKGCEIGWHVHVGDTETYYIIRGCGEYSDNGEMKTVSAGDVTFTPDGEGHSLKNPFDEPLEVIALVLYT